MASIETAKNKRGEPRYRVRVRVNGCDKSKTFKSLEHAKKWGKETEARADPERAEGHAVAEMIDKYCTEVLPHKAKNTQLIQYGQLQFWKSYLGRLKLSQITTPDIAKGKALLSPKSNNTINSYLAALSHCYTVAVKEWEWCAVNPVGNIQRMPKTQERTRCLTGEERARLLFYAKLVPCPFVYTITVVALSTGPRKSEIRNMKFSNYDHIHGKVILDETKTGARRTVRLFGLARELMAKLYESRQPGQELFFPSPHKPSHPVDFQYSWVMALEKAKIPNFCFHDLRHSSASYLAEHGATLQDIKEILGHKSIQTTQKYVHLTEGHTAAIVQKMNLSIF
jgi:integrase